MTDARLLIALSLAVVTTLGAQVTEAQAPAPLEALRILVLHGPNTNLFGIREPGVYGTTTFAQINERLQELAGELGIQLEVLQSNHEGVLVDAFHEHRETVDGAIINPAGLSFFSVPLLDAISPMPFPVVEVHISNLATRDENHRNSIISAAAMGTVSGLGWRSYTAGLRALVETVREEREAARSAR